MSGRVRFKIRIFFICIMPFFAGCILVNKPVGLVDGFLNTASFPDYSGPKVKITVADFEVITAKATSDIGLGLKEVLIAGLLKSGRFELSTIPKEEDAGPLGLVIATRLLDFEPYGSGGKAGVGGGGSASSGSLPSLLGPSINRSYISLDIRIVDFATSKVLFSERISAQVAGDYSPEEELLGKKEMGHGLSIYAGTSMGEAINRCIFQAVERIIHKIPPEYYKGGQGDGEAQAQGKT
ncbi:MAG: CsgG/HfaB family protein [Candidatus Omnitrophota bacterium]